MKKILLFIFSSILLTIIFIFIFQFIMHARSQKGALQVTSAPESKVYVNGTYLGTTPLCKCEASDMLKTGDYTIRLVPTTLGLSEFQEKITIAESVLTVVDRKFAKDSLSEGSVISLTPLSDKKKTELLVASLPQGAKIYLDTQEIGKTPLSYKNPTVSDHVLRIAKNGYKEKTVRIRTPEGYKLTVAVYLSVVDTLDVASPSSQASTSALLSVTPFPSPRLIGDVVLILDTPTGFLRVRETVGGAEIGRVLPGESYKFTDEQTGWVQIVLKDGAKGWVSSQYTKKQGTN